MEFVRPLNTLKHMLFGIWGFGISCILLISFLAALLSYTQYEQEEKNAYQEIYTISKLLAKQTEQMITGLESLFDSMNIFIDHMHSYSSFSDLDSLFLQHKNINPSVLELVMTDKNGSIMHWSGTGKKPRIDDLDFVTCHLSQTSRNNKPSKNLCISDPYQEPYLDGKWIFGVSKAHFNASGEVNYILVAMVDILALKNSLQASSLLSHNSLAIANRDGYMYSRIPGHEKNVGKQYELIVDFYDRKLKNTKLVSPADNRMRYVGGQIVGDTKLIAMGTMDTEVVLSNWRQYTLILAAGTLLIIIILVIFIQSLNTKQIDLSKSHRHQKKMAMTDGLTKLLNRRHLHHLSTTNICLPSNEQQDVCLLLVDIDHFKIVNDTYGHVAGDKVLVDIASSLKTLFRQTDILIRFGGEEFIAILPNTSLKSAGLLAEKFRHHTSTTAVWWQEQQIHYTVSIGVCQWEYDKESLEEAIGRADNALYRAKHNGRNCVEIQASEQTSDT